MDKGKISKIVQRGHKLYFRTPADSKNEKRYRQFREELLNEYSMRKKGRKGFTEIYNGEIDINKIRGRENWNHYIMFFYDLNEKKNVLDLFTKFFTLPKVEELE